MQRRRDTEPELRLRRALYSKGLRYRLGHRVPTLGRRTIDIAFLGLKVAVFVDGCFWHACPDHATWPKNNAEWWRAKLAKNVARDRETDAVLEHLGWKVIRVWEHEDPEAAAARIGAVLRQRRVASECVPPQA